MAPSPADERAAAKALAAAWAASPPPDPRATAPALASQALGPLTEALVPLWFDQVSEANPHPQLDAGVPFDAFLAWVRAHLQELAEQLGTTKLATIQAVLDAAFQYRWSAEITQTFLHYAQNLTPSDATSLARTFESNHPAPTTLARLAANKLRSRATSVATNELLTAYNQAADLWVTAQIDAGVLPPMQ